MHWAYVRGIRRPVERSSNVENVSMSWRNDYKTVYSIVTKVEHRVVFRVTKETLYVAFLRATLTMGKHWEYYRKQQGIQMHGVKETQFTWITVVNAWTEMTEAVCAIQRAQILVKWMIKTSQFSVSSTFNIDVNILSVRKTFNIHVLLLGVYSVRGITLYWMNVPYVYSVLYLYTAYVVSCSLSTGPAGILSMWTTGQPTCQR